MNLENLEKILAKEPKYRYSQVKLALFRDLADNWDKVQNLPLALRKELKKNCPLDIRAEIFSSKKNDSAKARLILDDGVKIETVLLLHRAGRNTVCLSSQAGCPLGCSFCATGRMGFKRNLKSFEIVEQFLLFARHLKKENKKITNVVFMGMGEPFLNYDNVMAAVRILNEKEGINLGQRHISISTSGITEGIRKFSSENLEVNLAVSLHAPNDKLRSEIMPVNRKYPIAAILRAVDEYILKTRRKVMFEYLMIKDVNDSDDCARALAKIMSKRLYLVNLILYNPTGIFKPSPTARVKRFKEILEKSGVAVTQRYRFGGEISAACGQLAA